MTKIKCELTACAFNNSCCCGTFEEKNYCTKAEIEFCIDVESDTIECGSYTLNGDKKIECSKCQIKKYGAIQITKEQNFEFVNFDDSKF